MTKLACSFTDHLDLCDSKVGAFLIPQPAPPTSYSQGALTVAQTGQPRVKDQVDAALFQSILQIKSLRVTKTTTINTKYRS